MKTPRPYQETLERQLVAAWMSGLRRFLLVLPTGGGKSLTMGMLIRNAVKQNNPVFFLAHREELIRQMRNVLIEDIGIQERQIGTILSGYEENRSALIQIGSIQTVSRRELPFLGPSYKAPLVFIDEAHRACGSQYDTLILKYMARGSTIIGATATPLRLDRKPLGKRFEKIVLGPTPEELATQGYLAVPRVFGAAHPNLDDVPHDTEGEFEEGALAKKMCRPELVGEIVPHYERLGGGQRAFVFAVNVMHATLIADAFRKNNHAVALLTGTTARETRRTMLEEFNAGTLKILVSVGVLLEGVDCPAAKVCIWARPTESLTVYLQGTGRVLRPWGNVRPVILDHAGNVDRHGMPLRSHKWSLDHAPPRDGKGVVLTKVCPECDETVSVSCRICPTCRAELVEVVGPPIEIATELVERESVTPEEKMREIFLQAWKIAKKKGWKPTSVYMKCAEQGFAVPHAWMNEVHRDCANDPGWKRAMSMRWVMKKKRIGPFQEKKRVGS